ncbi:unnamed protein product, partial [Polarella glacialis]
KCSACGRLGALAARTWGLSVLKQLEKAGRQLPRWLKEVWADPCEVLQSACAARRLLHSWTREPSQLRRRCERSSHLLRARCDGQPAPPWARLLPRLHFLLNMRTLLQHFACCRLRLRPQTLLPGSGLWVSAGSPRHGSPSPRRKASHCWVAGHLKRAVAGLKKRSARSPSSFSRPVFRPASGRSCAHGWL